MCRDVSGEVRRQWVEDSLPFHDVSPRNQLVIRQTWRHVPLPSEAIAFSRYLLELVNLIWKFRTATVTLLFSVMVSQTSLVFFLLTLSCPPNSVNFPTIGMFSVGCSFSLPSRIMLRSGVQLPLQGVFVARKSVKFLIRMRLSHSWGAICCR